MDTEMLQENEHLTEALSKLNTFMSQLNENVKTGKLLNRLRKMMTVDYPQKREILRFYMKELFTVCWN